LPDSRRATKLADTLIGTHSTHDDRTIGKATAMMGLEGAILVPVLILGSAAIIYYGLISVRPRQLERRRDEE
jgi:hypothetical protein